MGLACEMASDGQPSCIRRADSGRDAGDRDVGTDAERDADSDADARVDATADADAGDAAGDATSGDADAAAPEPENLYLVIRDSLVTVDPESADYTMVGSTGLLVDSVIAGAWDPVSEVPYVIVFDDSLDEPRLGTIDLCTGAVTPGARLSIGMTGVGYAEGTVVDPATGTLFVSVSAPSVADYLSETFGSVNVATGAVTALGVVSPIQEDIDAMTFSDEILALDVDSSSGARAIYSVSATSGATTPLATLTEPLIGIAYSRARGQLFAYRFATPNRELVTIDLEAESVTPIGTIHTDADFAGGTMGGFFFAPRPTCP